MPLLGIRRRSHSHPETGRNDVTVEPDVAQLIQLPGDGSQSMDFPFSRPIQPQSSSTTTFSSTSKNTTQRRRTSALDPLHPPSYQIPQPFSRKNPAPIESIGPTNSTLSGCTQITHPAPTNTPSTTLNQIPSTLIESIKFNE